MSTNEAFIIHNGNYDEPSDETADVYLVRDKDYINIKPPLTGCSVTDILDLAEWVGGSKKESE